MRTEYTDEFLRVKNCLLSYSNIGDTYSAPPTTMWGYPHSVLPSFHLKPFLALPFFRHHLNLVDRDFLSSKGTLGPQTQELFGKLKEYLGPLQRNSPRGNRSRCLVNIAEFEVCHYLSREAISKETEPESRSSGKIEVWHFLRQRNNPKGSWRSLIEIEAWHLF